MELVWDMGGQGAVLRAWVARPHREGEGGVGADNQRGGGVRSCRTKSVKYSYVGYGKGRGGKGRRQRMTKGNKNWKNY